MRILITGGLGFIGSNFVRYMADNAEIIVVDALKYGSNENNLKDLNCKVVNGDICDYELMAELVKGMDAIVNFAAETHVDRSISNPFAFFESNVIGTYTILSIPGEVDPQGDIKSENGYDDTDLRDGKERAGLDIC